MSTVNALQFPAASTNDPGSDYTAKPPQPKPPEKPSADSVHVSAAAQAELLEKSGETVAEIAANLGTTAQIVDQYLGITTTSTTAVQIPPAAPAAPHK